jgi:hypothetical protein
LLQLRLQTQATNRIGMKIPMLCFSVWRIAGKFARPAAETVNHRGCEK